MIERGVANQAADLRRFQVYPLGGFGVPDTESPITGYSQYPASVPVEYGAIHKAIML
jgi:hypothetical protein